MTLIETIINCMDFGGICWRAQIQNEMWWQMLRYQMSYGQELGYMAPNFSRLYQINVAIFISCQLPTWSCGYLQEQHLSDLECSYIKVGLCPYMR
jgi:hypothetical protein